MNFIVAVMDGIDMTEVIRTDNTDVIANACKKIAELEKENAELRAKESFVGDQNRKLCEQQQKIEVLEAENAELKTKVTALENANRAMVKELDDTTSGGLSVLENVVRSKEQLTNAKVALRNVIDYLGQFCSDYPDCVIEAEQFLKEM